MIRRLPYSADLQVRGRGRPKGLHFSTLLVLSLALPVSAATVDGIPLHSTSHGSGGTTLMLVHGWTCDDTSWAGQVPELSKQYRVITLDLPGHGQSGSPKDGKFSMDLFARAVEAVRAEQKVDHLVLVGHSMGTSVIRHYARRYPQHVAALVIVDGTVFEPTQNSAGTLATAEKLTTSDGPKLREGMIKGLFTPRTPPAVQTHVMKMMLAAPPATAAGAMIAMFDPAVLTTDAIAVPVYGIYAEHSGALRNLEFVKKVFPRIQYVEVPSTGHFLMMEQPQEFNRLLMAFVGSL